jgi:hypothetical protein
MENIKEPRQRIADDLIIGAPAIAEELGTTQRQVYHLAATKRVPIGRWGKRLFAFRSELLRAVKALTAT